MWWHDRFEAKRTAATLTFADVTPTNVSMRASLFASLGGFDERLGPEAAAHELAIRALQAGVSLEYEPGAAAQVPIAADTRETLAGLRRIGADHALIANRHGLAMGSLASTVAPGGVSDPLLPTRPIRVATKLVGPLATSLADALEWCRLRGTWRRAFRSLAQIAYTTGYAAAGGPRFRSSEPELELDLAASDPIPTPAIVAPLVHVRVGQHRLGTFRPRGGQWGSAVAEQAIKRLDSEGWRFLARRPADDADAQLCPTGAGALDGTVVVYGPGNYRGDDLHAAELVAAGVRVERAQGAAGDHWEAIAEFIAQAPEQHVAVTLPGVRATAEWLAMARVPLTGSRVAIVAGVGVPRDALPLPTVLASRATARGLYRNLAVAPQFAVLSTHWIAELGGIDPSTAHFGVHAPLLDLIERAFEAGLVVAHQETRGIDPPGGVRPARARLAWNGAWARGGLLTRAAAARGPVRGAALLAGHLVVEPGLLISPAIRLGEPSARSLIGDSVGKVAGCVHALATRDRWQVRPSAPE
jgi:hypothetical protein